MHQQLAMQQERLFLLTKLRSRISSSQMENTPQLSYVSTSCSFVSGLNSEVFVHFFIMALPLEILSGVPPKYSWLQVVIPLVCETGIADPPGPVFTLVHWPR